MNSRSFLFVTALSLIAAGTLSAQTPAEPMAPPPAQDMGQTLSLSGTVVSLSADSLVLDTDTGRQTFMVDTQSTLPAGLAAGNRVSIDYHNLGSGKLHAATVNMLPTESAGTTGMSGTATETTAGTTGVTGTATETTTGTTTATTPPTGTPVVGMGDVLTLKGRVVSSSGSELVITTDAGNRTFIVDTESRVPSGLNAGDEVTIEYHTLEGNRFHAANVTTLGAGTQVASAELPQTASQLPLVGLAGLLALVAALGLRAVRRSA